MSLVLQLAAQDLLTCFSGATQVYVRAKKSTLAFEQFTCITQTNNILMIRKPACTHMDSNFNTTLQLQPLHKAA